MIWRIILHTVEFAFLVFHASVAVFVCSRMAKKDAVFRTGFFAIYLLQSVMDCGNFLLMLCFLRLTGYGVLPLSILETSPLSLTLYFFSGYFAYFEYLSHLAIAVNRNTMFRFPVIHSKLWSGWPLVVVISFLMVLPAAAASPRWFATTAPFKTSEGYGIFVTVSWLRVTTNFTSLSLCIGTMMGSAVLEASTLLAYRSFSSDRRCEMHGDFRLLLYSVLQLTVQVLWSAFYTVQWAAGSDNPGMSSVAYTVYPYAVDLISLSGSTCLFLTSSVVRKSYLRFLGIRCIDFKTSPFPSVSSPGRFVRRRASSNLR